MSKSDHSAYHRLITTYTEINGQTASGTPEFSAVTTLDDHQIDYYDSNIKKLIPRQDWMKKIPIDAWMEDTEIREKQQQIYRNNNHDIIEQSNEPHGVHVYQRRYGCVWDDVTGDSEGFDEYGYDGEDFISLDLKENRYISHVPQAIPTVEKWNNDIEELIYLKQYYDIDCVYRLKKCLHLSKAATEKTELPEVSLLQKKQDNYVRCHATSLRYRDTRISWIKNGQAINNSMELKYGDTRPNGDGTFQRTVALHVPPNKRKKDNYTCVVEHKSLTYPICTSMTDPIYNCTTGNHINMNGSASVSSNNMYLALIIIPVFLLLIPLYLLLKLRNKPKDSLNRQQEEDHKKMKVNPWRNRHRPGTPVVPSEIPLQNLPSSSPVDGSSQLLPTTESFYKAQETS